MSGYPQPDVYWRKGRRDIDVRKGKYNTLSDGSLQVIYILYSTSH